MPSTFHLLLLFPILVGVASGQRWMHQVNHPAGPMAPNDLPALASKNLAADDSRPIGLAQLPATPKDSVVAPDERVDRTLLGLRPPAPLPEKFKQVVDSFCLPDVNLLQWACTAAACLGVVMCGVLPAVLLPIETGAALHSQTGVKHLNVLLSFAVGSLLGDVFLHLLPEMWSSSTTDHTSTGLWVLTGLLICFLVEKFCAYSEESQHTACAMMNLVANIVDNFTHGLAVGGSFLFGALTTCAILIHEIPHEIGDFAILLRADFDRWSAVKAQLFTATGGVVGAVVALSGGGGGAASWILPFTAGGFLNIALVQVLPDLMRERNSKESIKQLAMMLAGVVIMGVLNSLT